MENLKLKLLSDLIEYMSKSQGGDLHSMMMEEKKPPEMMPEEGLELEMEEDPEAIKVEKLSVGMEPKDFDEKAEDAMSEAVPEEMGMVEEEGPNEDELEELLAKLRG